MYAKSTRPSAKRDDQVARPRRAQTCERSELRATRMYPRSGQIFFLILLVFFIIVLVFFQVERLSNIIIDLYSALENSMKATEKRQQDITKMKKSVSNGNKIGMQKERLLFIEA